MSDLTTGKKLANTSWKLQTQLTQESWGQIWRVTNDLEETALTVVYQNQEGKALFQEALPTLLRWKEIAFSGVAPGLLNILEIHQDQPDPFTLIQDPNNGLNLRQYISKNLPGIKKTTRALRQVTRCLLLAETYDIPWIGLAPDLIIEWPGNVDAPWAVIPLAPGATNLGAKLWEQRYSSPKLGAPDNPENFNGDVYALGLILAEMGAGNTGIPRDPATLKSYVLYERLRMIVDSSLTLEKSGAYPNPKLLQFGLERWLKNEADEDIREHKTRIASSQRSEVNNWLVNNKKILLQITGLVAGLLFLVWFVFWVPTLFTSKATIKSPYGLAELFFDELIDGDAPGARIYTKDEATGQVDRILAEIGRMEKENQASKFATAVPHVQGAGNARVVKIALKGENGDLFMNAEMTIKADDNEDWYVANLFFASARTE